MATATRPRISQEFLRANTRERILVGTAAAIVEHGYHAATVTDIVRAAHIARNTFYDCFGSKEKAALPLIDGLLEPGVHLEQISEHPSLDFLLVEIAAAAKREVKDPDAAQLASGARDVVEWFTECELVEPPAPDDPRQQLLPPGRNGLPPRFKSENQRTRLLCGFADVVAEWGLQGATIERVCTEACVSRRTFYEHFDGIAGAAKGFLASSTDAAPAFVDMAVGHPLPALTDVLVEILAQRLGGDSLLAEEALKALPAITAAASG